MMGRMSTCNIKHIKIPYIILSTNSPQESIKKNLPFLDLDSILCFLFLKVLVVIAIMLINL